MSQLFASDGQSIGASASATEYSNEYSGVISFRIDWFDLFAVQRIFKSVLQHHNLKVSILGPLCGPTRTSARGCWTNHSFAYTELCQQSDVSAFFIHCLDLLEPAFQ